MRKLIDYIRSCFCKHEWEVVDKVRMYESDEDSRAIGTKWVVYCKKCGSFKKYKNY